MKLGCAVQYARNPMNGYVELAWSNLTWLWVLLAAPFYFALRGMWGWVVMSASPWTVAIGAVLSAKSVPLLIGGIIVAAVFNAPFAIAAKPLIRRHYGQLGWVLVDHPVAAGARTPPAGPPPIPRRQGGNAY